MIDVNDVYIWLLITAVIFTYVGRWMSFKTNVTKIIELTIDNLVADGFIKTRLDKDGKVELLRYNEE